MPLPKMSLVLRSEFSATRIFEWNLTLQDGTVERFVGTHGPYALSSGAGTPRDRASWSNSLSFGKATVTGTLYYTSAITMTAPDNGEGCISVDDNGDRRAAMWLRSPRST